MAKGNRTVLPVSRVGRFVKLAGMTASLAGRYASSRLGGLVRDPEAQSDHLSETYGRMAEEIADTLGELKGAILKVGQFASQTKDLLPAEFGDALRRLQNEAPPMDWSVISAQIEAELGSEPDVLFAAIDREPYAAASIGQVHRATTLDNREVIVKVQYPGVDACCDSDLRQLRTALRLGGLIQIPREAADALFQEIRSRIHEELDYVNEAANMRLFRAFHQHEKGLLIPEVVDELSTRRVLTMEYLPGDRLEQVRAGGYSQEVINLIGHRLFTIMADQLFRFRMIHGDPHGGNFAFRPDGTVIMYDFGCVKRIKTGIVQAYREALKAALREDYSQLDDCLVALGVRVSDKPPVDPAYYAMWRGIFIQPFASRDTIYHYARADIHTQVAANVPSLLRYAGYFLPPVETLIIDRVIAGHYYMMAKLGVQAAFRVELDHYLQTRVADDG